MAEGVNSAWSLLDGIACASSGSFPVSDDNTVAPMPLIESAWARDVVEDDRASAIRTLKVARFGSNRSVLAKLPARGINFSESPSVKGTSVNLRAELWFATKALLEQRGCKLVRDKDVMAELAAPRFKFSSSGKLQVESKDDMKKRGLRWPDIAEAAVTTMAADARLALYGVSSGGSWNTPLKRGLLGVA